MKVSELIEALKTCDPDAIVCIAYKEEYPDEADNVIEYKELDEIHNVKEVYIRNF